MYEQKKCLSYPRTDSVVLGSQNVGMAGDIVNKLSDIYPGIFAGIRHELIDIKNKRVFNDARLTDHHALIPLAPVPQSAGGDEKKIYGLVLKRFAAAFYPDFEFEQTDIITEVEKEEFQTRGKRILNLGWKAVYQDEASKKDEEKKDDDEPENLPPLINGDPAIVKDAGLEKKMTQPPPEYTEALLLKDMTNPGRYVSEDELKKVYRGDTGLGTQATRAQIIETLLTREYLIRIKKQLKATDKGCRLIESLRRFNFAKILTSPEETARWEMQLEQIAQGNGSDTEFLNGIKNLVQNIIQEFKTRTKGGPKVLGKCPDCGGDIIEGKKGYGCSNWREEDGSCRFVVWKNTAQKNINIQMLKQLLEKGSIGPFDDFISKKGSPFSAELKLVVQDGKWEVKFDFDNGQDEGNKEPVGKCPVCGGNVIETQKAYGCSNWKEEDGACKFVIWKTMAQKEISRKAAAALLENGITDQLFGFISRKGKAFSARLKLEGEKPDLPKVVFVFPD